MAYGLVFAIPKVSPVRLRYCRHEVLTLFI
jgi:uncharacterized protein YraI